MKNVLFSRYFRVTVCICVLSCMVLCIMGCGSPGETRSEVNRRHKNAMRTNQLQIQDDLDAVFMLDSPSKLSDKLTR